MGVDASTGICDSSLTNLTGVFVMNNDKRSCDGQFQLSLHQSDLVQLNVQHVLLGVSNVSYQVSRLLRPGIPIVHLVKKGICCKTIHAWIDAEQVGSCRPGPPRRTAHVNVRTRGTAK